VVEVEQMTGVPSPADTGNMLCCRKKKGALAISIYASFCLVMNGHHMKLNIAPLLITYLFHFRFIFYLSPSQVPGPQEEHERRARRGGEAVPHPGQRRQQQLL